MTDKVPLEQTSTVWAQNPIGWVKCFNCNWIGRHSSLLREWNSTKLYCPLCTSTRWIYVQKETVRE